MTRRDFLFKSGVLLLPSIMITPTPDSLLAVTPDGRIRLSPVLDYDLLLDSIAMVETGGDDSIIGSAGERSKYQLTQAVFWKAFPQEPFRKCQGELARLAAEHHLHYLDINIPRISITETHFRHYALAWAWNGGLRSWRNKEQPYHIPHERRIRLNNYAVRVTNLYDEVVQKRVKEHAELHSSSSSSPSPSR